eukprot:6734262-Prymnesium_polylepis.1
MMFTGWPSATGSAAPPATSALGEQPLAWRNPGVEQSAPELSAMPGQTRKASPKSGTHTLGEQPSRAANQYRLSA